MKEAKRFTFVSELNFFQKQCLSHLQRIFAELVHTQKKMNYQLNVVLKKQSFVDGGKNKIIFGWASRIWEDFLDRPFMQKTKKFRSFYILSRLGRSLKWNWLKQFSCRFASSLSKLRILERQIRGSQRNCFFCCWLGIVSSFFLWMKCFAFHFLLSLKKQFWLHCCKSVQWKQKQQWDKFRVGKKLERKAKSFNMAD